MDEKTYKSLRRVIDCYFVKALEHYHNNKQPKYHIYRDLNRLYEWSEEVAKDYQVNENVAGTPNALEKLFNSLPERDKRRE